MENMEAMNLVPAPNKDPMAPFKWALNEMNTQNTKEIPGHEDNPRIVWYHAHTTLHATNDETPWCASFVCTALEQSGFPSTRSAAASSFFKYGDAGTGATGDIVVLKRVGGHHVAFINHPYTKGDKYVELLGGNQSNKVCVSPFKAEDIIAIRKVKV